MMVYALVPKLSVCPITDVLSPNFRRQKACDRTTTFDTLARTSSLLRKVRPAIACTPSSGKKSAETYNASRRSAPELLLNGTFQIGEIPATELKD